MKKLLPLLTLCMGLCCVSCYDDSPILERLETLEKTTISALQASISALEAKDADILKSIAALENSDRATQEEIETLKTLSSEIEKKIVELKEWVEKILEGYYTSEEIDGQLASINEAIKTLTEKVSSLENTLNNLTAEFAIVFDDSEVGILADGTTSVGYTITGATEKTTVKALGQNGWSAKVTPNGTDKGTITVTAPNPMSNDEIIVLVYDGEFRTIMSTINFVTGIVTPSQTAVELEAEEGTIDITVTSNLNYKVSIPEDAKEWLSVVDTKVTKTETMTFAFTANEFSIRRAEVSFVDDADNIITKVSIIQQGSATEVTLSEAGKLLDALGVDLYKSIKSLKINGPINGLDIITINRMSNLRFLNLEDASIVEGGEYESGHLAEDNTIGALMFGEKSHFEEIILPNSVTSISGSAFIFNTKIKKVSIGENTLNLGDYAFQGCTELSVVIFNNKLQRIGKNAFSHCSSIESLSLPHSLIEFGHSTFGSCSSLKEISIPESVTIIKDQAFNYCRSLKSITLPPSIQAIEGYAFYHCDNLTEIHIKSLPSTLTSISSQMSDNLANVSIYIPEGTYDDYYATPLGNSKQLIEE